MAGVTLAPLNLLPNLTKPSPFHIVIPTLCSPLPTRQIYLGAPSPSTMGFKFKVNIDLASSE